MGAGSTAKAAKSLGFSFVGIDVEPTYVELARKRVEMQIPADPSYSLAV